MYPQISNYVLFETVHTHQYYCMRCENQAEKCDDCVPRVAIFLNSATSCPVFASVCVCVCVCVMELYKCVCAPIALTHRVIQQHARSVPRSLESLGLQHTCISISIHSHTQKQIHVHVYKNSYLHTKHMYARIYACMHVRI